MQPKKYFDDVNNNKKQNKLTIEEIMQFPEFVHEDPAILEELADFIYYVSIVLYKSNHYEPS